MRIFLQVVAVLLVLSVHLESQAPYVVSESDYVKPSDLLDWPSKPVGITKEFLIILHNNPNKDAKIKEVLSVVDILNDAGRILAYSYIVEQKHHIFYYENGGYTETPSTQNEIEKENAREPVKSSDRAGGVLI